MRGSAKAAHYSQGLAPVNQSWHGLKPWKGLSFRDRLNLQLNPVVLFSAPVGEDLEEQGEQADHKAGNRDGAAHGMAVHGTQSPGGPAQT